jgi:hypothetical protein
VITFIAWLAIWLFLAAMISMQYRDEAAHYMARWIMRPGGYAVVYGAAFRSPPANECRRGPSKEYALYRAGNTKTNWHRAIGCSSIPLHAPMILASDA